ncbi:MAG: hypothetical protein ABIC18_05350 [Candidatus Omnitrophota bacterium]
MNKAKLIDILVIIMFFLIVIGYSTGFSVYRDYKKNLAYLDSQDQLIKGRFADLKGSLKEFKITLNAMADSSSAERREILSKIENLEDEMQNWQDEYTSTVIALRQDVGTIQNNIDLVEKAEIQDINLGEISVEKKRSDSEYY